MESPRIRTAHRNSPVDRLPLSIARILRSSCSVAPGHRTTINGTDQLLATSISQPHLVALGAGEMIRAPLICSGSTGARARSCACMSRSVAQGEIEPERTGSSRPADSPRRKPASAVNTRRYARRKHPAKQAPPAKPISEASAAAKERAVRTAQEIREQYSDALTRPRVPFCHCAETGARTAGGGAKARSLRSRSTD
jgi:hypothetical protein